MHFASDNTTGAHPAILQAVAAVPDEPAMPYGADPVSAAVEGHLQDLFDAPHARVFLVTTGTAANALALASLVQPWQTVFCHSLAHIAVDECAAPEFYTAGAKLTLIEGAEGKLTPEALGAAVQMTGKAGVHGVKPGAVSLTQATEAGTVYSAQEVAALCAVARSAGLPVHMDGTRFANALVATGASPADLSWRAGVDILCLGATKNGALAAEAVILFDPAKAEEFALRRKRGGHLLSKLRFVATQMQAWLTDGLWLTLAEQANQHAALLAKGLAAEPGVRLLAPVQANIVFAEITRAQHRRLRAAGASYYLVPAHQEEEGGPEDSRFTVRLVTSYRTQSTQVQRFLDALHA